MFAPKPFDVAKEMVRVTKPGGRIVMGNWIPERSDIVRVAAAEDQLGVHASASGRLRQPHDLGCGESHHRALWPGRSAQGEDLHGQGHVLLSSPDKSPTQFIELFEAFYGPTMNAVEAAEKNGKAEELHRQLVELAKAQNKSKDAGTLIPATFMRVTVV